MTEQAEQTAHLGLERAIDATKQKLSAHIDSLHDTDEQRTREDLRQAWALLGCLARLTRGRTMREIHAAFGAPGDFGYETPIGDALRKIYGC